MKYFHHIVMDDGDKFDVVLDFKLTRTELSNERWLPYTTDDKTIYLNIAHISRIIIKELQPIKEMI